MTTTAPAPTGATPSDSHRSSRRRERVRVPSVLQLEATECGAASLGMVLAHFGRFVPLEELRVECGVSRDGSNAKNIVKAARGYGLVPKAYRREPEALKSMSFPLIIHWRFFHFLVVEGWYEGGWYLNDPALGPRTCDATEFDTSFTGIVIEATPGPDFTPGGKRPGVFSRLARAAGRIRMPLIVTLLISLLLLVPTVLVPQLVQLFGNSLAGTGGLTAQVAITGLLLAAVVESTLLFLQGSLSVRMASKISVRLGASMVDRLLRLPASFHAQRGASVTTQRALVADSLSNAVSAVLVSTSAGLLTATIGAIVLLLADPAAGIVAIVMALLTALAVRTTLLRSRDLAARVVVETVESGAVVSAALSQIESIKASGSEDGIIARGLAAQNRLLAAQQRIGVRSLVLKLLPGLLGALSTLLVSLVAALQVLSGQISPGAFLAVLALSAIVIGPIGQVVVALDQAQTLRASLDQVDDVLVTPPDVSFTQVPEGDVPAVLRGELELRGVSFGYSRLAPPVVSGLDLHVRPGNRVALVGPSGCGKSTVSRLVTGLYEPWEGEVLLDGRTRLEHSRAVLADGLALVDQDVSIFAGTVRENVTLWDPSVSERDVLAAIRDAQLEDDVARRPGGLDAVLDEGGADLSGGQRQRLEIARALVRNPRLLVMDEATSALDPITEQRIDEAIRRRGITCLVIAHRLSTIRDSDEIVVLQKGEIVQRGTHEQLMAEGGAYALLVGSA